jgi:hypothetical protein
MKINYASLHNMNETHISFEAIRPSGKKVSERDSICKQKTNKRKNNVVRGFKRMYMESV